MVIVYFIVAFVSFFFMHKKYVPIIRENIGPYDEMFEYKEFWYIVLVPLFWPIALPMVGFWMLLEKIYKKYFDKTGS